MVTILTPDICVIGAGSGGLTVAAAAAAFGVQVVLIEKGKMGGDCLNYGCVPSKAMLAAGKHAQAIRDAVDFGITTENMEIDPRLVNDHVRSVIEAIEPNDSQERFTAMGVTVIRARAEFVSKKIVRAGDHEIRARRFVIATGSSPSVPPIEGLDEVPYFTNETIFDNRRKIGRLVVIGGGPIGMEMAQAHARLGSRVTVLEADKAMGKDDPELTSVVLDKLRGEGIDIRESAKVLRIEPRGKTGMRVHVDMPDRQTTVDGTHLLVATGRTPNIQDLGLDKARVKHDRRGIKVNRKLRTSNSRIFAIGDVAGALQFTHVAGYHASQVVRTILFRFGGKVEHGHIPWVTFTDPELAHVGMSEADARKKHRSLSILRWPMHENDRAQAERKTAGLIKIVADRKGAILGATIAGANAGEMIHVWALAIAKEMTLRDITAYVAPYPTFSEIGRRAAVTYYTPLTRKPSVRRLIKFLRFFG